MTHCKGWPSPEFATTQLATPSGEPAGDLENTIAAVQEQIAANERARRVDACVAQPRAADPATIQRPMSNAPSSQNLFAAFRAFRQAVD